MYTRPAMVNTGGGVASTSAAFSVSLWLGTAVAVLTLIFAAMALMKILPAYKRNRRFKGQ